ncbi:MAG: hypothetical protein QM572_17515 [Nocardioides sp.]|uniref:hypothetical protein n=1 Tax=Nocardioides sp. TaxID=35761 RepID=UPI0039E6AD9E
MEPRHPRTSQAVVELYRELRTFREEVNGRFDAQDATLDRHEAILNHHTEVLDRHAKTLDKHTAMLEEILRLIKAA